jgi:hypothetical protein
MVISVSLKHAESDSNLRFTIAQLVVAPQVKTFPISDFQNSAPTSSPSIHTSPLLSQTPWKGISAPCEYAEFDDSLHFIVQTSGCGVTSTNVPKFPIFKIPPAMKFPSYTPVPNHNQNSVEG